MVGLGTATVPAFLLQCRLAHPQCYGGAAALLSSAPGAALHLPLPLQVKSCAGGRRGGPAPSLGTLHGALGHLKSEGKFDAPSSVPSNVKQKLWPPVPDLHRALGSFLQESSKHSQVRGWAGRFSCSRGQLEGQPLPRPLRVPAGQRLRQAAAGGGRPALPAGGAARPAARGGPAAGARWGPPVQHRHRQPVLPAHERLGAAGSHDRPHPAINSAPSPSTRLVSPSPPRPRSGSPRPSKNAPPPVPPPRCTLGALRPVPRLSQSRCVARPSPSSARPLGLKRPTGAPSARRLKCCGAGGAGERLRRGGGERAIGPGRRPGGAVPSGEAVVRRARGRENVAYRREPQRAAGRGVG